MVWFCLVAGWFGSVWRLDSLVWFGGWRVLFGGWMVWLGLVAG